MQASANRTFCVITSSDRCFSTFPCSANGLMQSARRILRGDRGAPLKAALRAGCSLFAAPFRCCRCPVSTCKVGSTRADYRFLFWALSRGAGQGGAVHSLGETHICCEAPAARHHFLPPLRPCTEVSAAPGAARSPSRCQQLGSAQLLRAEPLERAVPRGRAHLPAAPSSRSPALSDGHRGDHAAPGDAHGRQRQAHVADGADGLLHRLERLLLRAVLLPLLGLHGGRRHERMLPLRDQRGHEDHVPHSLQHPGQWARAPFSPLGLSQSPAHRGGGAAGSAQRLPAPIGDRLRAGGGKCFSCAASDREDKR